MNESATPTVYDRLTALETNLAEVFTLLAEVRQSQLATEKTFENAYNEGVKMLGNLADSPIVKMLGGM